MTKVDAEISVSMPATEDTPNRKSPWIKLGGAVREIDTAAPIDPQLEEGLVVMVKAIRTLDGGLKNDLLGLLAEYSDPGFDVSAVVKAHEQRLDKVQKDLIPRIAAKVKELMERATGKPATLEDDLAKASADVKVKPSG